MIYCLLIIYYELNMIKNICIFTLYGFFYLTKTSTISYKWFEIMLRLTVFKIFLVVISFVSKLQEEEYEPEEEVGVVLCFV